MGFDEGRIILDKSEFTFYAGETVSGRFKFTQEKTKIFRGIYVLVKGSAQTHWRSKLTTQEDGTTENHKNLVNHYGEELFFQHKQYLVGNDTGEYQLYPGQYTYPFQCQIPEDCLSSFEGEYGHIRYKLKVVVDKAFKFDQEKKIAFKVIAPLDLNLHPHSFEPIEMEFEDSYCCWCVSAGHVTTHIKVPASGFCPGQVVPVEVHCTNNSNVKIEEIKLAIVRAVQFHSDIPPGLKDSEDKTVVKLKKGPVAANTTRNWTVDMALPPDMPYNITNCRIIEMKYYFEVTVFPSGCHDESEDRRDIIIGSVPLRKFMPQPVDVIQSSQPVVAFSTRNTNSYTSSHYGN